MYRGRAAGVGLSVGLLAVSMLTTGCLRAQVAAAVSSDDTVTGEMVIASVVGDDNDPGVVLTPQPELATRIRTQPYRQDGYAGTRMLFDGLSFEDFGRLSDVPGGGGESNRLRFQLRRSGGLVLFTGRVDLIQVPAPDRVDVTVRMSFPGRITATNGRQTGSEIAWRPPAGEISELTATVSYADPTTPPWTRWAALVGGMAGIVVVAVMVLAFVAHRRAVRQLA